MTPQFTDGVITVALDELATLTPSREHQPIVLNSPNGTFATVLEHGGDVIQYAVEHECRFASRGAAEDWAYDQLYDLLRSTAGNLICAAGTVGGAFFSGGEYRLAGECLASGRLNFIAPAPLRSATLTVQNEFGGEDTSGAAVGTHIVFAGNTLGDYSICDGIRCQRTPVITRIWRCYGAHVESCINDAQIRFSLRAWKSCATRGELEKYHYDLDALLSTQSGTLTLAGGSTHGNCLLLSSVLEESVEAAGWLRFEFIKNLSQISNSPYTLLIDGDTNGDWHVQNVRQNILTGEECILVRPVRHDDDNPGISENSLVEVYYGDTDGTKIFTGNVVNLPRGGVEAEGITARAIGIKAQLLQNIIVKIGPSETYWNINYVWNPEGRPDPNPPHTDPAGKWSNNEVFLDILEHATGNTGGLAQHHLTTGDIAGTYGLGIASYDVDEINAALGTEIPAFEISGTKVGDVFTNLCEFEGQAVWWVDPADLALHVRRLDAMTGGDCVAVYAGEIGKHISENTTGGSPGNLVSSPMDFSIEASSNVIRIQGADKTIEVRPHGLPAPAECHQGVNSEVSIMTKVMGGGYDHRLWRAPFGFRKWNLGQLQDDTGEPYGNGMYIGPRFYRINDQEQMVHITAGRIVDLDRGLVCFTEPHATWTNIYFWARCYVPFMVTTTSGDPVEGFSREMGIKDEQMEHITRRLPYAYSITGHTQGAGKWFYSWLAAEVRDDTTAMTTMGERLAEAYALERISPEWTVRGIDPTRYALGQSTEAKNLSSWEDARFAIIEIEFQPDRNLTVLRCSNDVLLSNLWGYQDMARLRRLNVTRALTKRRLQMISPAVTVIEWADGT